MARALQVPARVKEVTKSIRVNGKIVSTIVFFVLLANQSLSAESLFLNEIIWSGSIISFLVILTQITGKRTDTIN